MELNESARNLIGRGADATLVTLNPDGSPQVSVVWIALQSTEDGDELVIGHLSKNGNRKVRNIRNDSRVAVTIVSPGGPAQPAMWLSVNGTARIVEGGAPKLVRELGQALCPEVNFVPDDAPAGFLTRIRIEKVGGIGPWAF